MPLPETYRWILPPPLPDAVAQRFSRACPPLLQVLFTRQVLRGDPEDAARLQSHLSVNLPDPDPFTFRDMDRAVDRILQEVDAGGRIGVFGHYDCDGITSTVLVADALTALGAQVVPYIPSRSDDYGIPVNGIERLAREGVKLIVTVDCGTKAIREVEFARGLSIDVVITDHHQVERFSSNPDGEGDRAELLPAAAAVVNPRRADCPYPFKMLAGVGVSFRLAQALARARPGGGLSDERIESLLDLVCVGTVADVVDLVGENRCLVAHGLKRLQRLDRPGFRSLAGAAGLTAGQITAKDVAFRLAPRLNAAGRLEHGALSHRLLCSPNCPEAAPLAERLEALNEERRRLTNEAVEAACERLGERLEDRSLLVALGNWLPGLSGLVASKVKDRFGRPALAITWANGDGTQDRPADDQPCVGSARSVPGFDITAALGVVRHRLLRYGGHAGAAGFAVRFGEIEGLEEELDTYASLLLPAETLGPQLPIEALLSPRDLTRELAVQMERLEPFGQGNPAPVFLLRDATVLPRSLEVRGPDWFSCRVQAPAAPVRVTGYGLDLASALSNGGRVSIVCQVSPDNRKAGIRLLALDVRAASVENEPVVALPEAVASVAGPLKVASA